MQYISTNDDHLLSLPLLLKLPNFAKTNDSFQSSRCHVMQGMFEQNCIGKIRSILQVVQASRSAGKKDPFLRSNSREIFRFLFRAR